MTKIAKLVSKILKGIFWFVVIVVVVAFLTVSSFEIAVKVANEPAKSDIIEKRDNFYEWCYNIYDDSKNWCINTFNETKKWFNDTYENGKVFMENMSVEEDKKTYVEAESTDEELKIDGAKLNDISSYEVGKYINFTIPYGWTIGKVDVEDDATEESILVKGKSIVMAISLKNIEGPKNIEGLKWTREAMIFDLQNTYSDYVFEKSEIIGEKAAVISITIPNVEAKMYMAIISANEKTIVVTYTFENADFFEGELYFTIALAEMVESLR